MSKKELERKSLMEAYKHGKMQLNEVADRLELSYRQCKRIWRRYKLEQDEGLQHRSRGKTPSIAYPEAFKEQILDLYLTKYRDFGPTFAAEKMCEDDGIKVQAETLRLWLKAAGLWHKKRKRQIYRERRERRPSFGDLLQIDGSIHKWFAGDDNYYCLLNMVDDCTGITLAMMDRGETTKVLLNTFKKWVECYGIPKAVYVDLKSVYVSPKRLKEKYDDDLLIQEGFSVFEQVCKELNIQIIRAYSPQAKGRVERKHAVFQDRFVKELNLYEIKTMEGANKHLEKFLVNINNKFARDKDTVLDSHRNHSSYGDLNEIFCWRYKRQLKNNWTIQFVSEHYQISKGYEDIIKPGAFVQIKKYLDGAMLFWFENTKIDYKKLNFKPEPFGRQKESKERKAPSFDPILRSKIARKNKHKTPWSRYYPPKEKFKRSA